MPVNEALWAIVPAAGAGIRAGQALPKQFHEIHGKTVLGLTVERLLDIPEVKGVVVSLAPSAMVFAPSLERLGTLDKGVFVVPGGSNRQESVENALSTVPLGVKWIAVHDGVRPCFTKELFYRVWEAAKHSGAAICGIKPSDTIKSLKRVSGILVDATLDRNTLVCAQTPQIFLADVLKAAHEKAVSVGRASTDDSQLVEALGHEVSVVEGEYGNLKITYPQDFDTARAILAGQCRETGERRYPVTGFGFDVHPLRKGRKCIIGGVDIPSPVGLLGHSDADVLLHAIIDGILGALSKGDIGIWYPPENPQYRDASSLELLRNLWDSLRGEARLLHVDATVVAETPKIAPYAGEMRRLIANALEIDVTNVSVKATTSERLGALGRQEGIAAMAVVTAINLRGDLS